MHQFLRSCVCVCVCVCVWKPLSCIPVDCSPLTLLSMGFSRQEYWSGLPWPPPGDLPNPRVEPMSPMFPALQMDSLWLSHQGSSLYVRNTHFFMLILWYILTYISVLLLPSYSSFIHWLKGSYNLNFEFCQTNNNSLKICYFSWVCDKNAKELRRVVTFKISLLSIK